MIYGSAKSVSGSGRIHRTAVGCKIGRGGLDGIDDDDLREKTASEVICTVSSDDAGTEAFQANSCQSVSWLVPDQRYPAPYDI